MSGRESKAATNDPGALGAQELELAGLPTKFGKYTLIRKLAAGGMAELFLAIQKSVAGFEKLIVIKRILPAMNQDRAFIDMLLSEARIAATLSHPNIVQIFDVGQEAGQYYIAMEHVHGEDLRSIVRQMRKKETYEFPLEHALGIVLGICAGLAYAHEKRELDGSPLNIVHRDISPQNVVVTFTGDVKIVDFGIAKSDSRGGGEATKSGKLKGKVPYMSPEQARGEDIDARSDLFATGVILFELTTGKRLFKGQSEYETLKLICEREYPRPSDVVDGYPRELEAIVMKALAKDVGARYQSAREMQGELEAFVRQKQLVVSSLALHQFMQGLFEEKLALQKEALLQGKQLADIIEMQHALTQRPEGADATGTLEAISALGGAPDASRTNSLPAASRTMTGVSAAPLGRSRAASVIAGIGALALFGGGLGWLFARGDREAPRAEVPASVASVTANPAPAEPSSAAPAAPARGTLVVESDPAGASIWINGDLRAERTPATIAQLPLGVPLDVKLTMEGFEFARQELALGSDSPETIRLALDKTATRGVKTGAARPAGGTTAPPNAGAQAAGAGKLNVGAAGGWCNVTVDGVARGATPVAGIELPAGPHKVTCTTPDGKTREASISVPADGTARYKFTLP